MTFTITDLEDAFLKFVVLRDLLQDLFNKLDYQAFEVINHENIEDLIMDEFESILLNEDEKEIINTLEIEERDLFKLHKLIELKENALKSIEAQKSFAGLNNVIKKDSKPFSSNDVILLDKLHAETVEVSDNYAKIYYTYFLELGILDEFVITDIESIISGDYSIHQKYFSDDFIALYKDSDRFIAYDHLFDFYDGIDPSEVIVKVTPKVISKNYNNIWSVVDILGKFNNPIGVPAILYVLKDYNIHPDGFISNPFIHAIMFCNDHMDRKELHTFLDSCFPKIESEQCLSILEGYCGYSPGNK